MSKIGLKRWDIEEKYPQIVQRLDRIFAAYPVKYAREKFCFNSTDDTRRLSWSKIFEIMEEEGWQIDISIKQDLSDGPNKQAS